LKLTLELLPPAELDELEEDALTAAKLKLPPLAVALPPMKDEELCANAAPPSKIMNAPEANS
jgi:hypothetical protein